jgi:hypothetical protein
LKFSLGFIHKKSLSGTSSASLPGSISSLSSLSQGDFKPGPGSVAPGQSQKELKPGPGSVAPGQSQGEFKPGPGNLAPGKFGGVGKEQLIQSKEESNPDLFGKGEAISRGGIITLPLLCT